ncbi:MAG: site-2 protease family protein [Acutalibacteraceae bacterium]
MSFRLFGCKISLSFPLLCALCIVFIVDKSGISAICCVSAVLHELGHIAAMYLLKTKPCCVKLTLFDINIQDNCKYKRSFKSELFVILSGAAVNLIFSSAAYGLFCLTDIRELLHFSGSNLFLAMFNLLPVESLDGGCAVFLFLQRVVDADKAEKILEVISFLFLLPLAVIGFIILLKSKYNFTLLFTSCYLMSIILLKRFNTKETQNKSL